MTTPRTDHPSRLQAGARQRLCNGERAATGGESQFKHGEISVRELVRRIAKSELYREQFFDACSITAISN